MRFLADESCDADIARALRNAGHDVASVSNMMQGAAERRVLLTEDKDFGQLVFAAGASTVVGFVTAWHAELAGSFVVITPTRTRIRRPP